jgi:hypothetical protein
VDGGKKVFLLGPQVCQEDMKGLTKMSRRSSVSGYRSEVDGFDEAPAILRGALEPRCKPSIKSEKRNRQERATDLLQAFGRFCKAMNAGPGFDFETVLRLWIAARRKVNRQALMDPDAISAKAPRARFERELEEKFKSFVAKSLN